MLPLTGRACSRPRQWKHGHEPARLATWTTYTRRRLQVFSARILSGCPNFCKAIGETLVAEVGASSIGGRPLWSAATRALRTALRALLSPFSDVCAVVDSRSWLSW